MQELDTIAGLIPPKYQWLVTLVVVGLPLAGRGFHALKTGGGIRGLWNAVMFGTNTPKPNEPQSPTNTQPPTNP